MLFKVGWTSHLKDHQLITTSWKETARCPSPNCPRSEMNVRVLWVLLLSLHLLETCAYLAFIGMTPFDPTPTGMWSNIAWASCSFTGWTSLSSKLVLSKRTPQLMSNPTPPAKYRKVCQILGKPGSWALLPVASTINTGFKRQPFLKKKNKTKKLL